MPINKQKVEFVISAVKKSQLPADHLPEIALVGRSNVGKSSFINALLHRKNLARTSGTPGKTQTLNYYRVDGQFYFVDLPGYGYAKVSNSQRQSWLKVMKQYFKNREEILMTLLLVDFRHEPSDKDVLMKNLLDDCEVPYFIIATKADKVKSNQWNKHTQSIFKKLDLVTEDQILPVSAKTGEGIEEAWEIIEEQVSQAQDLANERG